jgi:hypothetical protein
MFKVDFEKAYDSVDWEYLDEVMHNMNFPHKWRMWIMECISSASASILVNGSPTNEFRFERGLRQGDPLSPFLFLLAAEGFHLIMDSMVAKNMFMPYSVGTHLPVNISHLQFADDTLLIGTKSWSNIRALRAGLLLFEKLSGLKVNFHKSMLFGVNINTSWLQEAALVMRCKHGTLPFLYLGLPIGGDPRRLSFWYPLVDRIRQRLSGWKCKNLSYGGRLILLKSVLSSIPVYFLSFFKAPSGIISSLDSIFCQFFWGGSEDTRKLAWIKWDTICMKRECGGLGVKRLREFNYALLGKWVWRVLEEKDSLWCSVLKAKYGHEGGRVCLEENVGSPWWRAVNQIRLGRGLLEDGWLRDNIVRRVGNGRESFFWKDTWLAEGSQGTLARSFSRLYDLAENKLISVHDMFLAGWGLGGEAWKWRRRLFAWEEELVLECIALLSNIVLQDDTCDRWVWRLHSSHQYTVHSAYTHLTDHHSNINDDFVRFRWLKSVPLKVNIFIWRLFLNRLPTKSNLHRRGVLDGSQTTCVTLCGFNEDVDHLFFQCEHYGRIWYLVSRWLGVISVFQDNVNRHAIQFSGLGDYSKGSLLMLRIIWVATLYAIWLDRNSHIFRSNHDRLEALVEKIKLHSYWWLKSNYVLFDFDYKLWSLHPLGCSQAIL